MNAIVVNTLSAAVTEYTNFEFHSITPTHAGSATGLFEFGGDLDLDLPIVAVVNTALKLRSDTMKKSVESVYFAMRGAGSAEATVFGKSAQWSYRFPVRTKDESRCVVGRGIYETYLGFGFRNPDGEAFIIDRIEALVHGSSNRRI